MSGQPPDFIRREVWMAPETEIPFDACDWRDALVFIASGALDVDLGQGARARFETGAILCFDRLRVRSLRNTGSLPLVLIAVSRPTDESSTWWTSKQIWIRSPPRPSA